MALPPSLRRIVIIIGASSLLAAAGCGVRIPQVTPELVAVAVQRDATVTAERLERGRSLYVNRCGSCHSLSAPGEYSEREWNSWVHKMAPKSRLNRSQEMNIVTFLVVARDAAARAEAQGRQLP